MHHKARFGTMSQPLTSHGPDQRPRLHVRPVGAGKLRPLLRELQLRAVGAPSDDALAGTQVGGLLGVPRGRPDLVLVPVQHVHGHARGRERRGVGAQLGEDAGDAHQVFRGRVERADTLEFRPSDAGFVEVHVGEVGAQHLLARAGPVGRGSRIGAIRRSVSNAYFQ